MYTQSELNTILTIGIILIYLAASVDIYWILLSRRQTEAIRRAFARYILSLSKRWVRRWEKDHRIESYVKGLRRLADE